MSLQIGIVGLPNVGKSTLFNALTRLKAEASNYPFCTIDPNVGVVEVPDVRIDRLSEMVNPQRVVPTAIEFVDIAGLVKNAHAGEGLGNTFLDHIRNVDAICHVVRNFTDENVIHVDGSVQPARDVDTIKTELAFSDLSRIEKRRDKLQKECKSGDAKKKQEYAFMEKLYEIVSKGDWISEILDESDIGDDERKTLREMSLLTTKRVMYAVNVSEDDFRGFDSKKFISHSGLPVKSVVIPVSAKIEHELIDLTAEEAQEYLDELGMHESGLVRIIQSGYDLLDLITFFTAGVKEVRAWTIKKGTKAPQAAGVIHTDFEKAFIRVEAVNWKDLTDSGGYPKAREKGLVRTEGKEYVMQDGDTVNFLHSA